MTKQVRWQRQARTSDLNDVTVDSGGTLNTKKKIESANKTSNYATVVFSQLLCKYNASLLNKTFLCVQVASDDEHVFEVLQRLASVKYRQRRGSYIGFFFSLTRTRGRLVRDTVSGLAYQLFFFRARVSIPA